LVPLFSSNNVTAVSYDLDLIDLEILDLHVIPMDDKPYYPYDNSDLVKIQFNITNTGLDYFVLSDKMFKIRVMDRSFADNGFERDEFYIVDNYFTLYDVELETRYDDYFSFELFADCEYLHDRIFLNEPETYWICFDILRRWNNEILNIDGKKQHYLTLMDNMKSSSCPNCKNILLSSDLSSNKNQKLGLWNSNIFYQQVPPPLKQMKLGILPEDIQCNEGFQLIFKFGDDIPACVSSDTVSKLIVRGWGRIQEKLP